MSNNVNPKFRIGGEKMKKSGKCCFCGKPYNLYGNNPDPVDTRKNARCCNACNAKIVIPARLALFELKDPETAGVFLSITRLAAADGVLQ